MTPEREGTTPATYEFTVAGSIGPLLRSALAPCQASETREVTILRTARLPERDLVDLVRQLHSRGLVVEEVFETGETSSPLHDARPGRTAHG